MPLSISRKVFGGQFFPCSILNGNYFFHIKSLIIVAYNNITLINNDFRREPKITKINFMLIQETAQSICIKEVEQLSQYAIGMW